MPQKVHITLMGISHCDPYEHSTHMRALVLQWLKTTDSELATTIHDANQPKPYTISPLRHDLQSNNFYFDVSVLADWLSETLLDGIHNSSKSIHLGPQVFEVDKVTREDKREWIDFLALPWEDEYKVRLITPTAHHAPGEYRKSIILPNPDLYFGSWINRWNLCSDIKIDEDLMQVVKERMVVVACSGETQTVHIDRNRFFIGFEGQVRFRLLKSETVSDEAKILLTALARFSTFCGTGVDTMRGMGQTRYIRPTRREGSNR